MPAPFFCERRRTTTHREAVIEIIGGMWDKQTS